MLSGSLVFSMNKLLKPGMQMPTSCTSIGLPQMTTFFPLQLSKLLENFSGVICFLYLQKGGIFAVAATLAPAACAIFLSLFGRLHELDPHSWEFFSFVF